MSSKMGARSISYLVIGSLGGKEGLGDEVFVCGVVFVVVTLRYGRVRKVEGDAVVELRF